MTLYSPVKTILYLHGPDQGTTNQRLEPTHTVYSRFVNLITASDPQTSVEAGLTQSQFRALFTVQM